MKMNNLARCFTTSKRIAKREALFYHSIPKPGKITVKSTKSMGNIKDMSLAYSPGVAEPCLEIANRNSDLYRYTSKGNMVALVSNGSSCMGMGDVGPLAAKPVMEGKSMMFNRFGGVETIDLCVDTKDKDEFVHVVKHLAPSFGAIALADLAAPDCYYIEKELIDIMDIPVIHDDTNGVPIVALTGLINACEVAGKEIEDVKIVINGAGNTSQGI